MVSCISCILDTITADNLSMQVAPSLDHPSPEIPIMPGGQVSACRCTGATFVVMGAPWCKPLQVHI